MKKKVYLTTTLPYVNSDPHIGFALELIQTDVVARANRLLGSEVFFNTGTDEHGLKIYRKAEAAGQDPQTYVDTYAAKFDDLKKSLNLSYNNFIRTTDQHHIEAAQAFWRRCDKNGDIYKKQYQVKYCVGCELEKTDSELVDGYCPLHPGDPLEIIEEENYFFRFSKYAESLLNLYQTQPDFVLPAHRQKEIANFVSGGLQDFSISRLKEKMPWGVPVPDDPDQVMYVWFDALVNYISALGWPDSAKKSSDGDDNFASWWPVIQFAGKDNLRQQSAIWQAMLMSAGLPPSKQIVIHGFINVDGQKMSKSLGNVVNPLDLVNRYGADALRYYLLRHVPPFEDGDFTEEKFKEIYNANLANGLGNLTSRIMTLAEKHLPSAPDNLVDDLPGDYLDLILRYEFNLAGDFIWQKIGLIDKEITDTKPFSVIKEDKDRGLELITALVSELYSVAVLLEPYLPEIAEKIKTVIRENRKPTTPLFIRHD